MSLHIHDNLITSIVPIGDGITFSVKTINGGK